MYMKRQNQSAIIGENWQFSCEKQGIINRDCVRDETKINYELNPFFSIGWYQPMYSYRGIKQRIHTSLSVDWFGFGRRLRMYIHFVNEIPCVKSTGDSVYTREMDGEIQRI